MVATVGSIQVAFGADLRAYEASLRRGEKTTDRFERNANKATQGVGNAFIKMGGLARAGLAGLAAGLVAGGVTGIVGQLSEVARGVAQIGDEAKRAGVSAKVFQEWRFVAEQNRIGIDQMTDGLKELNLRADEFVQTGKGSASEAFQRLGYSSQELAKKLKDPSALMLEIIDRLGKFDKAAQIRIADELFGGSAGERFVELLDQGEAGIRATIDRAHELGIVMNDELIAKAAVIDQRFNEISNTVGMTLKSAIVSAADSLVEFIDGFREFEKQRSATLQNRLTEIGQERLDLETQILKLQDEQRSNTSVIAEAEGKMLAATIRQIEEKRAALNEDEARILATLSQRTQAMTVGNRTWTPPTPPPGGFGSSGGSRDKAAAQAEREAEAVRRLIGELEHELALIGATDLERDLSIELRNAGAAATEGQRAKIVSLVAAMHAEAEAQRQATDAAALYRDIASGALNDLRSALSDGKLEWQELGDVAVNALNRIVDKLLDDVLGAIFKVNNAGASGGGGNLLGTLGTLNLTEGF